MIGLVIVAHGALGTEFRNALEHVVGHQDNLAVVSIGPDDDMAQRRTEIIQAAKDADTGAGVIVLTDMFGGTPSNLAISVIDDVPVEVIAGINLPILVKLASLRSDVALHDAVIQARDAARKYIKIASEELTGNT